MKIAPLTALAVSILASAAAAAPAPPHAIVATDAWSRPAPNGLPTGVIYVTLVNRGERPDRLLGASTPLAARVSLHRSSEQGGVMSMTPIPGGLDIPAGATVKIAPGGYHLMLEGLKRGLQAGAHFPATLRFAHAGAERVEVQVRSGPPAMAGMTMR